MTNSERTLAWIGAVVFGLLGWVALGVVVMTGGDGDTAATAAGAGDEDVAGTDAVAAPFVAPQQPTVPTSTTPSTASSGVEGSALVVEGIEAETGSSVIAASSTSTTATSSTAAPTTAAPSTAAPTTAAPTTAAPTSQQSTTAPSTTASSTTTTAPPTTSGSGQSGDRALEQRVIDLTNAERQRHGCPPLANNDRLHAAALAHSVDMAEQRYFSHTSLDGSSLRDRIDRQGYSWRMIAENIAMGYRTPESVVDGWMNSAGHRANILNCDLAEIGVGHDRTYWTQNFGSQR